MLVYDFAINGKPVARCGKSDLAVLTACVSAVGVLGPESSGARARKEGHEIKVELSGLTSTTGSPANAHLSWFSAPLKVGDEIAIKLVEASEADPHVPLTPEQAERLLRAVEEAERTRFERARKLYFELKDKYE